MERPTTRNRRHMATRFAVQVIPNRFPTDDFYGSSVALKDQSFVCRTITCDGAPGRIRTLSLLIRRLVIPPEFEPVTYG